MHISRDLHDNIGSQLTFISSSVDNIKYGFDITNPNLNTKIDDISGFAKDTIVELRETIWAMNNNDTSFEDLQIKITILVNKAKEIHSGIRFDLALDQNLKHKVFKSLEIINIYRCVQEALNNSLKYAIVDYCPSRSSVRASHDNHSRARVMSGRRRWGVDFGLCPVHNFR